MTGTRTAILLSGSGSNFAALAEAAASDPAFPADLSLVISNRPQAYGLERAKHFGIPTQVIDHRTFGGRDAFDAAIADALSEAKIEFVCLAGFMRILTPGFVAQWEGRMLNIHPSLLPAFRGHNAHTQVLESSVTISGCTVHTVTADLDAGPIVAQAAVPRQAEDTEETLSARVRAAEHLLYPLAVRAFLRDGDAAPTPPNAPDTILSVNAATRYVPSGGLK